MAEATAYKFREIKRQNLHNYVGLVVVVLPLLYLWGGRVECACRSQRTCGR